MRAWLVTTARREAQRTRQKAARTQPFPTAEDEEGAGAEAALPDPAPLPDAAVLQLEEQHLVRTALARLDERCRQLLTLLFYQTEPATYDEITATVGMPSGSIGPTRARCLEKLGKLLKENGF